MKKLFLGVILILSFILAPNVYAFEIGVSSTKEYLSGIFQTNLDNGELFIIPPKQKSAIAILYGEFHEKNANLGKIEVNITGANEMNLTVLSTNLDNGDTINGANGNYVISIGSATSDNYRGKGLFVLTMPNVSSSTKYNVSVTAKAYDKNNNLILTKNATINYNVAVKETNCDNNLNVNISTSAGVPTKVPEYESGFGLETYGISTTSDVIDINVIPESSKTDIHYIENCVFTDKVGIGPKQNIIKGFKLNYSSENSACFFVLTECYRKTEEDFANIDRNSTIIGSDDWYESIQYTPNLFVLNITRNDNRSKINTLKSLSISDVTINFNPDLKNYTATVPYEISSVKINSTLSDSKSSYVSGYGNRIINLNEGNNDVEIKVKAENGDETTYTIKITREGNDDATLKTLKINDKEIKIEKDIFLYNEYVNNDIVKLEIKAEPSDSNAKVEIEEINELKEGINEINITVTSVAGNKQIYTLNVVRDKLISENSKLKNITITNHKIEFNSDIYEYIVDADKNEDELDIIVETEHQKAQYLIIGNKNLKDNSIIKIKVTAEDGKTVTTYELKINKESSFNIMVLIIPIVVILMIVLITLCILIKKNKNKQTAPTPKNNTDNILPNKTNNEPVSNNNIEINKENNIELSVSKDNSVDLSNNNTNSAIKENTVNSEEVLNSNNPLNNYQSNNATITSNSNNQINYNELDIPNANDFWNNINK